MAGLVGYELPPERPIDGKNIWPLMAGEPGAESPHEAFYFYWAAGLHAVRSGDWKLHLPHDYRSLKDRPGRDGIPGPYVKAETDLALYNLREDVGEKYNVAVEHPEVVERMLELAEQARDDLGDALTKRKGKNVRPPGRLAE